jgi:hypothetical protein
MDHQTGPAGTGPGDGATQAGYAPGPVEPDVPADDASPGDHTTAGAARSAAAAEPAATGDPRVDAALKLLDRLPGLPVGEHPELFEQVHAHLSDVLGELDPGSAGTSG